MELADGTKAVVDPGVQAYISSLVTAVCFGDSITAMASTNTFCSLEAAGQTRMDVMCLETMPWHVYEI